MPISQLINEEVSNATEINDKLVYESILIIDKDKE